ncbi:hypothetical protein DFH08DRAFT_827007 [Mycena albidolilacea]|uniref:Uncharacterized protein n=1 Tax=Mycena albidolilacea TaxID=1033008 RepID=A0AAD7E8B9_9AGAR|nr:hypothetical protein DFH08DRAFT_827007 [Mycena albidolilacea]
MYEDDETILSVTSPCFGEELTMLPCVVIGGDGVSSHRVSTQIDKLVRGKREILRRRFSAKRGNGLAKLTNGLASRSAGLGFDLQPNPSPSPNKPIGAGTSPFGKPKNQLDFPPGRSRAGSNPHPDFENSEYHFFTTNYVRDLRPSQMQNMLTHDQSSIQEGNLLVHPTPRPTVFDAPPSTISHI